MIREFYQDRTILLTGGTGFYGQALTAKILRYLPGIRRLYLILRTGRGANGQPLPADQRMDELFSYVVFDRFRREEPAAFATVRDKVRIMGCDMRAEGLGLSVEDRAELLAEVDLIIGNAASVTFDEPLDSAIHMNALAPQELLRLARDGVKKPVLVHVSTAYANGRRGGQVPEQILPTDRTIRHIIDGVEPEQPFVPEDEIAEGQARCQAIRDQGQSAEQEEIFRREIDEQSHSRQLSEARIKKLIDDRRRRWIEAELVREGLERARRYGWNDVYTFTKAMGEQLLVKHCGGVPLAIVRPSTTEGALAEPHPGWIHGLKVTDPLIVAYGRGMVPDFPAAIGAPMDLVPIDIVANTVIAAATRARSDEVEVFHAATSGDNPLPNTRMFELIKGYFEENPLLNKNGSRPELVDWTFPTREKFQRGFNWKYLYPLEVKQRLYERLPERLAPAREKRRLAALKTRLKRVQYFVELFSPYTTLDCRYETVRMLQLYESLPPEEQQIFNMDVRQIDWYQYYQKTHLPGLRRHEIDKEVVEQEPLVAAPGEVGGEEQRWRSEEGIRTIPDLLRWACGRYAAKTALQIERADGWTRLSYGELLAAAEQRACYWQQQGIGRGDKILLCGPNDPGWVVSYMAASLLGAAVVPIDPQTREEDIWDLCDFVGVRALVLAEKCFARLAPEGGAAHGERVFFNIDRQGLAFGAAGAELPATGEWSHPEVVPEDLASVIFTSASEPRGVMLSHRNLVANLLALAAVQPLSDRDRVLSTLPLHHALEFTGGLMAPLMAGATITYLDEINSREMLRALRDTRVTALLTVPRLLRVLADRVERLAPGDGAEAVTGLAHLRLVVSGGAALSAALASTCEQRLGISVCQGYGLSEAAPVIAVGVPGRVKAGSVGQVLPGQEVQIADPDQRGVGEILARGANITAGYYGRPELSEQILRNGWLHTGDLGYVDCDGYLFLTGRKKDLIVTGAGKNIYPQEVESLYAGLPQVAELGVVGAYSPRTEGEEIHGVAVLAREGEDAAALQQELCRISQTLPSYHRLHHLHIRTRPLPHGAGGAIDRPALLAELERDFPAAADPLAGLLPWEQAIYRHIGRIAGLGTGEVAAHADAPLDTLFDSLMAREFAASLDARLGIGIDVLDCGGETLRSLLTRLEADLQGVVEWEEDGAAYWARVLRAADDPVGSAAGGKALQGPLFGICSSLFRRYFDFVVRGLEHLPEDRPYLVAANHASDLDGACVLMAVRSRVERLTIAAAEQDFAGAGFGRRFLRTFAGLVPCDRHGDFAASLVAARRLVGVRRPLLVFPEGNGSNNGQLRPFGTGVGLLAHELELPVVPLHIAGVRQASLQGRKPERQPLRLLFGAALEPQLFAGGNGAANSYEVYHEITVALRRRVENLGRKNI